MKRVLKHFAEKHYNCTSVRRNQCAIVLLQPVTKMFENPFAVKICFSTSCFLPGGWAGRCIWRLPSGCTLPQFRHPPENK